MCKFHTYTLTLTHVPRPITHSLLYVFFGLCLQSMSLYIQLSSLPLYALREGPCSSWSCSCSGRRKALHPWPPKMPLLLHGLFSKCSLTCFCIQHSFNYPLLTYMHTSLLAITFCNPFMYIAYIWLVLCPMHFSSNRIPNEKEQSSV